MKDGSKTSERKACYDAFYTGSVIAMVGILANADLTALAALIVAVNAPLMWYASNRTYLKTKKGKENEQEN